MRNHGCHRYGPRLFLCGLFFLLFPAGARGDGVIVLHPPRPGITPVPLSVKYHHVEVEIRDQVAVTTVDQLFFNPNGLRLEGTYLFPLHAKAVVKTMSLWIDGKEAQAELLPRDEAKKIYRDIVRRMKDPALLEYMGGRLFRLRIFPIEPRSEKRVKITYTEQVPMDGGLCTYRYPLSTEKFSSAPLESVRLEMKVRGTRKLGTLFSPSHDARVRREGPRTAEVTWKAKGVRPDKDFILYYGYSAKDVGVNLAAFKETGRDGFFALFLTPPQDTETAPPVPKDVVFVVDTSGSMKEPAEKPWKIDQAKDALHYCINSLAESDRFDIVAFSTEARPFRQGLLPATKENREAAHAFVSDLEARGGTNVQAALDRAFALAGGGASRPFYVVFLTDGKPTLGDVQDVEGLTTRSRERAPAGSRLFAFGVGYDVNTRLLDKLALALRGDRVYVAPDEDLEVKVSGFYDKIAHPVLSGLVLSFEGVAVRERYPDPLPDLFLGSQLVVYGRYAGSGEAALHLRGRRGEREVTRTYTVTFPEASRDNEEIPRLWAVQRIAALLEALRAKGVNVAAGERPSGPEKELVDAVVELAKEYGIVTPYTALLVVEDTKAQLARGGAPPAPAERLFLRGAEENGAAKESLAAARTGFSGATGKDAFDAARSITALKKGNVPAAPSDGFTRAFDVEHRLKRIGGKTFYLVDGVWYDSRFREGMETRKIPLFSETYFDLVDEHPALARYFSAGRHVVVCFLGHAWEVVD